MAEPHDGTADRALDRFWDGIAGASPHAPAPPNLDPADAAAVRRFHALPDAPPPSPSFVARLEEELMRPHAIPTRAQPTRPVATNGAVSDGRRLPPTPSAHSVRRRSPRRLWWRALEGLAAAALLLAIAAGLVTGWGLLPGPGERPIASRAFGPATPGAAVIPGAAMERGNAARTGEVAGPGPAAEPTLRWRAPIAAGRFGEVFTSPVVADGVAYVNLILRDPAREMEGEDTLLALDLATKQVLWQATERDLAFEDLSEPAVADGLLYVGISGRPDDRGAEPGERRGGYVRSGGVVALDARTGEERWRGETAGSGLSTPAVADGVVVVGAEDGSVSAFGAANGRRHWRVVVDEPDAETGEAWLNVPAVAEGRVFVGDSGGVLHALDLATGRERWRAMAEGVDRGPVVADGNVYAALPPSTDAEAGAPRRLLALDAVSGLERWAVEVEDGWGEVGWGDVAASSGLVYVTVQEERSRVVAFDAASGRERWSFEADDHVGRPVVAGGALFVTGIDFGPDLPFGRVWRIFGLGTSQHVFALDATTGDERWRIEVPAVRPDVLVADASTLYLIESGEIAEPGGGTLHAYGGG